MDFLGDFAEDATVNIFFTTNDGSGGAVAPSTAFEAADVAIYKNGSATQKTTTNGVTMTSPFDSVTGLHLVTIDTSNDTGDAGFWATGNDYTVVLNPDETVDSQTIVHVLAQFSIENRFMRGTDSAFLAANAPTNFSDLSITATTGRVDVASVEGSDATDQIRDALVDDATRFSGADIAAILTDTAEIGAAGAGLTEAGGTGDHLSAIPWNAAWDAEVESEATDALVAFFTSAAQLVDDIWDEVITGAQHNVNNSAAKFLRETSEAIGSVTGTAQSATATTIVLESGDVTADDILNGERITIIEGTGIGQSRLITDSVASTDTVTVAAAWTTTPDATSVYSVTGAEVDIRGVAGQTVAATAQVDFDDLAAILADTNELQSDDVPGLIAALNDLSASEVNAEVLDVLNVDTFAELSSVPAAAATLTQMIRWLYLLARNQIEQTSTTMTVRADDGSTAVATSTVSDDGTTAQRGEYS